MGRILSDILGERPLILDGAMGTTLDSLAPESKVCCNELLNITNPDLIATVHRRFFEAGSDIVETNTFGGTPVKLNEYDLPADTLEINEQAAMIARGVADEFGGLVAGSMGPSGLLPSGVNYGGPGPDEISKAFSVQAEGLLRGSVDALIVETMHDILEMKSAIIGCRDAMERAGIKVPVWASVSLHMNGRMLMGTPVDAALAVALALEIDAFGLNCATGPREMIDAVAYLTSNSPIPVIVFPNAGMPRNVDGKPVFDLTPEDFSSQMASYIRMGVEIVGGCCGTGPEHIAALKETAGEYISRVRPSRIFRLASLEKSQELISEGSPLVIGERLNSHGSKKFRKLLNAEDWDGMVEVARQQERIGAQVLDVALASGDREDEAGDYVTVVSRLAVESSLPLMIDSVDHHAVRASLMNYPGIPIVNSINLGKPALAEKVIRYIRRYGGAVAAMLIDDNGMAKDIERKMEVAEDLYSFAVGRFGLRADSILFDPLTFTLATGEEDLRDAAVATIEAIPKLREKFPECGVVLGISNVSYGLPVGARKLLNTVFLHHAIKNGLTAAIVNPLDLRSLDEFSAEEIGHAEDLIFNRCDDAIQRLVDLMKDRPEDEERITVEADIPVEKKLSHAILERKASGLEEILDKCLEKISAIEIVNGILLPAMREVGERMERSETILPHVLRSAEVMKSALKYLEPHLESDAAGDTKKVVIATVFGDVHDIGKNLVGTILANNGFEVVDLGKQVTAREIVDAVRAENPIAVGLSALLVSTSLEMGVCVEAFHENGLDVPVIIGGAAVSPGLARKISIVDGIKYAGGVHYGKDAFEALEIVRSLATGEFAERSHKPDSKAGNGGTKGKDETEKAIKPKEMPFEGVSAREFNVGELIDSICDEDRADLYRDPGGLIDEIKKVSGEFSVVNARGLYGYFPSKRDGTRVTVIAGGSEFVFEFPEKSKGVHTWLDEEDYVIPYVVTIGKKPVEIYERLIKDGHDALALEWSQLCSVLAESAAEMMRRHVAMELGLSDKVRPLGVSPGYALWTEISDQEKLSEILGWDEIGLKLTDRWQIVPEYSTSGIVIIHPNAKYRD